MALLIALIVLIYGRYVYTYTFLTSCDNWTKGLNGTMMESSQFCMIPTPKFCPYELSDRIQDFSFSDCSYKDYNKEIFRKYYDTDAPFIGMADTT